MHYVLQNQAAVDQLESNPTYKVRLAGGGLLLGKWAVHRVLLPGRHAVLCGVAHFVIV